MLHSIAIVQEHGRAIKKQDTSQSQSSAHFNLIFHCSANNCLLWSPRALSTMKYQTRAGGSEELKGNRLLGSRLTAARIFFWFINKKQFHVVAALSVCCAASNDFYFLEAKKHILIAQRIPLYTRNYHNHKI